MPDHHATVESVFRGEYGRIIASLIRASHSFDLAEEALQDAFTVAVIVNTDPLTALAGFTDSVVVVAVCAAATA